MNTATAAAVGASLEVLAPYLPYGIKVEYPLAGNPYGETMRRTLVGIDGEMGLAMLSNSTSIWAPHCIPLLRPFSQLTVPLPTGEVPAVEVAKLARGQFVNEKAVWGEPELLAGRIRLEYRMPRTVASHLIMQDDWSALIVMGDGQQDYASNQSAIVDYLRSKHFALPINGRPLVANVDFIPLTAPSTPTREADASHE